MVEILILVLLSFGPGLLITASVFASIKHSGVELPAPRERDPATQRILDRWLREEIDTDAAIRAFEAAVEDAYRATGDPFSPLKFGSAAPRTLEHPYSGPRREYRTAVLQPGERVVSARSRSEALVARHEREVARAKAWTRAVYEVYPGQPVRPEPDRMMGRR